MTTDRPTQTGPVPAPESTHAASTVFRDRGVIIANRQARIAELEGERDTAREEAGQQRMFAKTFAWERDNFIKRSLDAEARAEAAEAETAALRARIEKVADKWGEEVRRLFHVENAPREAGRVMGCLTDLRALAGAPAVTPTETQAEDDETEGEPDGCTLNGCHPAPVADPTTGETR